MLRNLLVLVCLFTSSFSFAADDGTVSASKGNLKVGLLLQPWYASDSTATGNLFDTFRLRRAEIKFSGTVVERARFFAMIDGAKGLGATPNDNKVIQDLGVVLSLIEGNDDLELVMGQFKIPTTGEGLQSSSELFLPERSMGARAFGDRRDVGANLIYKMNPIKVQLMVSNGANTKTGHMDSESATPNNSKDLNARIDADLMDKTLNVGAYWGNHDFGSVTNASIRSVYGADAKWKSDAILVGLQYGTGKLGENVDSGITADLGYMFSDYFQGLVRYDSLTFSGRTLATENFSGSAITAGINYFLKGHNTKIQLAYTMLDNAVGKYGSYESVSTTSKDKKGGVTVLGLSAAL